MSREYFRLLDDLGLSDPSGLESAIRQLDRTDLEHLDQSIDEYYRKNLSASLQELQQSGGFNVYRSRLPTHSSQNLPFLRTICLYVDKLVVSDHLHQALSALGQGLPDELTKDAVVNAVRHLLVMRGLAEHGILVLLPRDLWSEEDGQTIDRISREDSEDEGFRGVCFSNMKASRDLGVTEDGHPYSWHGVTLGLGSTRCFSQTYGIPPLSSYDLKPGPPYFFHTPRGTIEVLPREVPLSEIESDDEVRALANQLIQLTARDLNLDLLSAQLVNSAHLTDFDVHWQLTQHKLGGSEAKFKDRGKVARVVPAALAMDLKFLDNVPIERILELREEENETFEAFRRTLRQICGQTESVPFTEQVTEELDELRRDQIDPELAKLDIEFESMKGVRLVRMASTAVVASCSILATVFSGNPFPLVGLAGIAPSLLEYGAEARRLKANSIYFLWRAKRAA